MDTSGIIPRIGQCRYDHAHNHGDRKVFVDRHDRDQQDDESVHQRHLAQDGKRVPRKGADHDHEHHTHKGRQRDLFDQGRADKDKQ